MERKRWEDAGLEYLDLIHGSNKQTIQTINGDYWRVMNFIENSSTLHTAKNPQQVFQLGTAYARLHNQVQDLDPSEFQTILPGFMDTSYRKQQLQNSSLNSKPTDAEQKVIDQLIELEASLEWEKLKRENLALGFHDCKISNVLFNRKETTIKAIVDFDTLMRGSYYLDFGDMVRSSCSRLEEHVLEYNSSPFSIEYFERLAKSFWGTLSVNGFSTEPELVYLGIINVIWQQATRFMSDHLNHDAYFKTDYRGQNLDRAQNQLKLLMVIMGLKPRLFLVLKPVLNDTNEDPSN